MHGPGRQFFSGSALAVNQDRALGGSNCADRLLQLLHRRTDTYNIVERISRRSIPFKREILPAEVNLLQRPADGELDLIYQSWRLANVVGRAARLHRRHCSFVVVDCGDQNDR